MLASEESYEGLSDDWTLRLEPNLLEAARAGSGVGERGNDRLACDFHVAQRIVFLWSSILARSLANLAAIAGSSG